MSVDWEVGDEALCIKLRHPNFMGTSRRLRLGSKYRVRGVYLSDDPRVLPGEVALVLDGVRPRRNLGFPSTLFIKVTPPREMIEEERKAGVPA